MQELVYATLNYATARGWAVLPLHGITDEGTCTYGTELPQQGLLFTNSLYGFTIKCKR